MGAVDALDCGRGRHRSTGGVRDVDRDGVREWPENTSNLNLSQASLEIKVVGGLCYYGHGCPGAAAASPVPPPAGAPLRSAEKALQSALLQSQALSPSAPLEVTLWRGWLMYSLPRAFVGVTTALIGDALMCRMIAGV